MASAVGVNSDNIPQRRHPALMSTPKPSRNERFGEDPHREYRAMRSRRLVNEFAVFAALLMLIAAVSSLVLWMMGVLGSGDWKTHKARKANILFPTALDEWEKLRAGDAAIVLAIYSEGCPGCKRMRVPFTSTAAHFATRSNPPRFVAVSVSATQFTALWMSYDVKTIPAVLFFPQGNPSPVMYKGSTSTSKLTLFVEEQVQLNAKAANAEKSLSR